ncbi:MAG: hypothetical protein K2R98_04340 [Gemmataceae bacterium]|nr:hypothetical protein [Gemmataceae bacterium]
MSAETLFSRSETTPVAQGAGPPERAPGPVQLVVPGCVEDWRKVRLGITLMLTSTVVTILAAPVAVMGMTLFFNSVLDGESSTRTILVVVTALTGAAVLAIVILHVVGLTLCGWAPANRGARGLAVATLVLAIGAVPIAFLWELKEGLHAARRIDPLIRSLSVGPDSYSDLSAAVNAIATIVFLFYVRAIALILGNARLARSARRLLTFVGVAVASLAGMIALMVWAAGGLDKKNPPPEALIASAACMMMTFGAVFLIWYLITLILCRSALTTHIGRHREDW